MLEKKLKDKIKKIIYKHLAPNEHTVFVFGSRAMRKSFEFSDIDVGISRKNSKPVNKVKLQNIKWELEESDILYKVDVVDFYYVDSNFKKIALKDTIKI